MLSYATHGPEYYGDATGQYIKNSTINRSHNRGIVVHGTNGVLVKNNIVFDTKGHGIFTEDAVERRNTFDHNLVLKVRNPSDDLALKRHELRAFRRGSSGFWISNPDNTTINNHVADCQGTGFWLAFPSRPFGASDQVLFEDGELMNPRRMLFGVFDNNTSHSNHGDGLHNDNPEIDEEGNTGSSGLKDYASDSSGRDSPWPYSTRERITVNKLKVWKNGGNGAWDRVNWVTVANPVGADNKQRGFAGSGFEGLILGGLHVGKSLNHGKNGEVQAHIKPAFASYHHTFSLQGNILVEFPVSPGNESGAFSTIDYYLRGAEKGHYWTLGNILINSHPGFKLTAYQGWKSSNGRISEEEPHFNLAGALWDPQGLWGPDSSYFVFDDPFYTYGQETFTLDGYTAEESGGVSTFGPYFNLRHFEIDQGVGLDNEKTYMEILATRYDQAWNEVGHLSLIAASDAPSTLLRNMKDIEVHPSGKYELVFPGKEAPSDLYFEVSNMRTPEDQVIFGVEFSGDIHAKVEATGLYQSGNNPLYAYGRVKDLASLAHTDGDYFYQDYENDKLWLKIRGGVVENEFDLYAWERWIYQRFGMRLTDNGETPVELTAVELPNTAPEIADQSFTIEENSANGTNIGTVVASDADGDALTFSIAAGNTPATFAIESKTGVITVADSSGLDYETLTSHTLTVAVADGKNGTASAIITINVSDLDDTNPQIIPVSSISVDADSLKLLVSQSGQLLATVMPVNATDKSVRWQSSDELVATVSENGRVQAMSPGICTITVTSNDGGFTDSLIVAATHPPHKPQITNQTFSIAEQSPSGSVVGTVLATGEVGDQLSYSITGGIRNYYFEINSVTGAITVAENRELDFELIPSYSIIVTVENNKGHSSFAIITIEVTQAGPLLGLDKDHNSFSVYPNPSSGFLKITGPGPLEISLQDLNGKTLATYAGIGSMEITLRGLAAGVYLLAVNDQKRKIILQD